MKNKGIIKRAALLLTISGMAAFSASAQTYTWAGGDGGTWNNTLTNWNDGSGAAAFPAGGASVFGSGGVTASGTTFTVANSAGIYAGMAVTGWQLPAGTKVTNVDGKVITIDKGFGATGNNIGGQVFTFYNTGTAVFSTAGAVNISGFQSAGRLTLNAANTFNSGTILANEVYLGTNNTFNSSSALMVGGGGIIFNGTGLTLTMNGALLNANSIKGYTTAMGRASTLLLQAGTHTATANAGVQYNIGNFANGIAGTGDIGGVVLKAGAVENTVGSWHVGGGEGEGVFRIEGGAKLQGGGNIVIARGNNAKGLIAISSGTMKNEVGNHTDILVGFAGNNAGVLNVTGGVVEASGSSRLAISVQQNNAAAYGTVNLSGSGLINVSGVFLGGSKDNAGWLSTGGTATLNVTGGRLNIGTYGIAALGSQTQRYINLSGGTVGATADFAVDAALPLTLSGAAGVTFDTNGKKITVNSALNGGGNFTKAGAGTLLLNAASNGYNGDATVSAGTLEVAGALTLDTLTFALDGASVGSITGAGTLTLSEIAFDMTNAGSLGTWNVSGIFGSLTPTWSGGVLSVSGFSDLGGGLWGNASYEYNSLTGIITTIPEPSALALMLTGGALLLFLRRKR